MSIDGGDGKQDAGYRDAGVRSGLIGILICSVMACSSFAGTDDVIGVGIVGIDHHADHLSVQDFSVDGYDAAQAGNGNRLVCCAVLPLKWRPGLTVKIHWNVSNWKNHTGQDYDAVVPVEPYESAGRLYVHFLPDGTVRAISSDLPPRNPDYLGPHDPIPSKHPWTQYRQPE